MSYRYTVDENFAVRVFNGSETVPFWFQPEYPNGDSFDSTEEATTWAEHAVASMDGVSPFPPNGKGLEPEVRKIVTPPTV
jgi:hypothetical protein